MPRDSEIYRRHLPHIQPAGYTYFATSRLAGSLPASMVFRLKDEFRLKKNALIASYGKEASREPIADLKKIYFAKCDDLLHQIKTGPHWLGEPKIATLVCEAMKYRDGTVYELLAYVIMPNHIHMTFTPFQEKGIANDTVTKIMGRLKGYTAWSANKILIRKGAFWQQECYDHIVRNDEELKRINEYILQNPVKAGLVSDWRDWPWVYTKHPVG